MKRVWILWVGCLLAGWAQADVLIKQLDLTGRMGEEELAVHMAFEAKVEKVPCRIRVLDGAVLQTRAKLSRGAELILENGTYYIEFTDKGKKSVSIDFEAKVQSSGQLRAAAFEVPDATIRRITLEAEKVGYTVEVAGASRSRKLDDRRVEAFLPPAGAVWINWSPELEKLSGDLVASCDSMLVGSAKVGALQLHGQFRYAIPQGRLKDLSMNLPEGLNIIQVTGTDLLAWNVVGKGAERMLKVELSRPHEQQYVLSIQAEQSLPEFPCKFNFPVVEPQGVIRANGVVLVGTDSTIKLLIDGQGGLTQIEPDAVRWGDLPRPARGLYAYMFANMPFSMKLSADNIVTTLHAQDQLVLALSENDVSLEAKLDLEVRDAPASEVELEVSKDWTVAGVTGQNVADYDVRDRDDARWITVYFKKAVDNRALVQVRLEKTLPEESSGFTMPIFRVAAAKSERGFIVLRGEVGTRLEGADLEGLREVNTGSLPVRIADARQAFRFKRSDWSGRVGVRKESASVHAESFQLVSLGESGVFGSSLITYNIANAPTRSFELRIPERYRNVEIHGRDIRNWSHSGDLWTIHLQQKVIGDYTLLVTYDHPAAYQGEELLVGGVQALGVENEAGYIALAGSANLSFDGETARSASILPIDVDEVPEEYALLVNDPIMHAYKYVAAPHEAQVRIKRFATQQLLTQVADHITLDTIISEDGEAVTVAVYHVKNTDRQYLPIRLPEGATLWTVKVDDRKTQVLDRGDGQVLVPVERRRDPNAPLKVEVTYAEQYGKPGALARMAFTSPEVETQSVFAQWGFSLPDGQRLTSATGNMERPAELSARRAGWGLMASFMGASGAVFWLVAAGVLGLCLYFLGQGRGFSLLVFVVVLVSLVAAVALAGVAAGASLALADSQAFVPSEWIFSKAVSGVDGGLQVRLTLTSAFVSVVKDLLLLLAGLIPVVWALVSGRRKLLVPLLAVLVGLYSFSPYLAWVTVIIPHLLLFVMLYMAGRRRGQARREGQRQVVRTMAQPQSPETGSEGFVRVKLIGAMAATMAALLGTVALASEKMQIQAAEAVQLMPEDDPVKADFVNLQVTVPEFETEKRVNVAVHMDMELTAEKNDLFRLLGPGFILTDYDLSSRRLSMVVDGNGSTVRISRDGDYKVSVDYLVPAENVDGEWQAHLWIPAALNNKAKVELPIEGWTLHSPDAIRVRQEGKGAEVLFNHGVRKCTLRWKPGERKTDREQSRFFCDLNTLADFRPGMVSLVHDVRLNIAQGQLRHLEFDVPAGMSITEVRGQNVGTWRYDPESGLLEVVLSAPASESYRLLIGAQIAREKLPHQTVVQGVAIRGAAMQRGVVALASSDAVQIDVEKVEDLSGINISDAARVLGVSEGTSIKRAFRYNQLPFTAHVAADKVLPELRLSEQTSLDVSTEQVRLTSRLVVTVTKSGIFALRIRIPDGFDVDSLSGEGVSHWDEVNEGPRELVVNFARQLTGSIPLNLVLSRSGGDLEEEFTVPRIEIEGARKHTGSLVVTTERGIRITPAARDGVSEVSPRELGIRQDGCLAYRLLRPDWDIHLQSAVMAPKIKAEVLQRVDLSEGLQKVHCYLQYDIEHAGVKTFRLQPPNPELALVVSGRNVSRVRKIDEENGIWEVELHGKVENHYGMEVAYQLPFDHDKAELSIRPLRVLGTDSQKGYITIRSSGRQQVKPAIVSDLLRTEDARSIPRRFGAGDLSDAVLCYRATEGDYELKINIVRHTAAEVLPAQVKSVRLDSVITKDDQSLNNMKMELEPGSLRFLEMRLPEGSEIWSIFVNETAVRPLVEDGLYLIPVESGSGATASVEVVYSQSSKRSLFGRKHAFEGPKFKLPLTDVRWTLYAPDGYRYSRFDGTMQYRDPAEYAVDVVSVTGSFDEDVYYDYNAGNTQLFGDNARQNIELGNDYMESGNQRGARQAFQKAIAYSQGQQALNEDARVQFRNLVRQQGVMGLVNRRNQLKLSLNQVEEAGIVQTDSDQWSNADVLKLEAELGEKESNALSGLAEKMLDQQQAASVEVHPIRVVMARQGSALVFERKLQLQSDADMLVEFRSARAGGSRSVQITAIILAAGVVILSGHRIFKVG